MSRVVNQNTLTFLGETKFKSRLSHEKVVHRETAANVCVSLPIKIIFLPSFSSWNV